MGWATKRITLALKSVRTIPLAKRLAPILVILGVCLFLFYQIKTFLLNSPFFGISHIEYIGKAFSKEEKQFSFCGLYQGVNIFSIDTKVLSNKLLAEHPEFAKAIVYRKLPDILLITIKHKKAIALIQKHTGFGRDVNYEYYPVSQDGVVLPKEGIDFSKLPVLLGLDVYNRELMVGKIIDSRHLLVGLEFVRQINTYWSIETHSITALDVSDYRNISLFLKEGPQIKIGTENIEKNLKRLEKVLKEANLELEKIKYIDLRFKEVVIGPK